MTLIRTDTDFEECGLGGVDLEGGLADTRCRIKELTKQKWLARKSVAIGRTKEGVLKVRLAVVKRLPGHDVEDSSCLCWARA